MSQLLPERRSRRGLQIWEPSADIEQIGERMRRMLEDTFGSIGFPSTPEAGLWSPPVDIEERDDEYVVQADLPGVQKSDVNVEVTGSELAITGELKDEERQGALRKRTRRTGRFEYRVALPDQLDVDKVDASLKDGVLTVHVPKSERAQRRTIELKS